MLETIEASGWRWRWSSKKTMGPSVLYNFIIPPFFVHYRNCDHPLTILILMTKNIYIWPYTNPTRQSAQRDFSSCWWCSVLYLSLSRFTRHQPIFIYLSQNRMKTSHCRRNNASAASPMSYGTRSPKIKVAIVNSKQSSISIACSSVQYQSE